MKPCKYAVGMDDEWECTCYGKIGCEYQEVDYNYLGSAHKEINIVECTKDSHVEPQAEGSDT